LDVALGKAREDEESRAKDQGVVKMSSNRQASAIFAEQELLAKASTPTTPAAPLSKEASEAIGGVVHKILQSGNKSAHDVLGESQGLAAKQEDSAQQEQKGGEQKKKPVFSPQVERGNFRRAISGVRHAARKVYLGTESNGGRGA
jgi:hypothetical protein